MLSVSAPESAMEVLSSDPDALITDKTLHIKQKPRAVTVQGSFKTDRAGVYTNIITLDKSSLQYNNTFYLESGYWAVAQMPYAGVGYAYKNFYVSVKAGYSFLLKSPDYSVGVGYKYSF